MLLFSIIKAGFTRRKPVGTQQKEEERRRRKEPQPGIFIILYNVYVYINKRWFYLTRVKEIQCNGVRIFTTPRVSPDSTSTWAEVIWSTHWRIRWPSLWAFQSILSKKHIPAITGNRLSRPRTMLWASFVLSAHWPHRTAFWMLAWKAVMHKRRWNFNWILLWSFLFKRFFHFALSVHVTPTQSIQYKRKKNKLRLLEWIEENRLVPISASRPLAPEEGAKQDILLWIFLCYDELAQVFNLSILLSPCLPFQKDFKNQIVDHEISGFFIGIETPWVFYALTAWLGRAFLLVIRMLFCCRIDDFCL